MLLNNPTRKRKTTECLSFGPDQYETPDYVFDMLLEELEPEEWTIWEPFPGSGHSTEYMNSKGFDVVNGPHADFFDNTVAPPVVKPQHKLAVVTNPPYSLREKIMKKLKALGVETIAFFVPIGTIGTKYFLNFFPQEDNQLLFHQGHVRFIHPQTRKEMGTAPFCLAWVTSGLKMKRDLITKCYKDYKLV